MIKKRRNFDTFWGGKKEVYKWIKNRPKTSIYGGGGGGDPPLAEKSKRVKKGQKIPNLSIHFQVQEKDLFPAL